VLFKAWIRQREIERMKSGETTEIRKFEIAENVRRIFEGIVFMA